ncbi:MAG TPA: dimethylamine monooxygenase subunit DmmA family protein [Pseudolysinimonas sp.]|nr:dimethylamine monooxygenase subunit DmmA family protein [Pseudolysinimonas sp.]
MYSKSKYGLSEADKAEDVVQFEQTSMPVWTSTPLTLPDASSVVGIGFGEDAAAQLRELFAGAKVPTEILVEESAWGDGFDASLMSLIERQLVGVRFVVVGPEQDVMRAESILGRAGAVSGEIDSHSTDVAEGYLPEGATRRVFCGYCRIVQPAEAAVGDAIICVNCGASLNVRYHFSRQHAAYLGAPNGEDLIA